MSKFNQLFSRFQFARARAVLPSVIPWLSSAAIKVPKERLSLAAQFDKLSVSVLGTGPDARRANELLSAAKAEIDKASFELDTLLDELRRIKPLTSVRMGAEQAPIQAPVHAKGDRPGIGEAARAASRDGAGTPRSDPFQQAA